MKNFFFVLLVAVLVTVGFAILVHHFLVSGRWFDMGDLMHHETFWVLTFSFTAGIILATVGLTRRRK